MAQAYDLKNLSAKDLLVIGHGFDKLPREETDADNLWNRIQQQINQQDQANAKAAADKTAAEKAALEATIREKIEAERNAAGAPASPATGAPK